MKRFVTYLYEYERTIRGRNVGFIRNDIRNDCCRMEIHIRGLERIKEKAPIFIIVRDSDCIGIPAGEIVISQGVGNACLELQGDRIGKTSYSLNSIQAIIIRYDNGKMLMGCYVPHPASDLLSGSFTKWEAQAVPDAPRGADDDSDSVCPTPQIPRGAGDDSDSVRPTPQIPRGAGDDSDSVRPDSQIPRGAGDDSDSVRPDSQIPRGADDDSDSVRPTPAPSQGIADDSSDIYPKEQNPADTGNNSDNIYPHDNNLQGAEAKTEDICPVSEEEPQSPVYKRIAITDIRLLPSRNWHLCNNSFLVHGFFCYHYLILKTVNAPDGAKMYLGVPGIYASQERMMALLFGFNDFETVSDGDFGYWLCPIET